jgi:hypothetical protein
MAIKVTITGSLAWTDGSDSLSGKVTSTEEPVGQHAIESVQLFDSTGAEVDLAGVSPGHVLFKNKDTVNSIYVTTDSTFAVKTFTLGPGKGVIVPTTISAWHAKAVTSGTSVDLLVVAVDA